MATFGAAAMAAGTDTALATDTEIQAMVTGANAPSKAELFGRKISASQDENARTNFRMLAGLPLAIAR